MSPTASRVLIVLFDGLRPDLVTPERMPALSAFLGGSRRFPEASSVFPSLTRVCATTIGTGVPPAVSGIIQNAFPDPAAREGRFLDTASVEDMRRATALHGPRFVAVPRFADSLAAAGRRFALVHSGSPGGAYLLDPRAAANGSFVLSLAGREASETPEAWDRVVERTGAPPSGQADKLGLLDYAGRAMADVVLPEVAPDVALLWLTEPDWSFHYSGMDTEATRIATRAADDAFARVLEAAERLPEAERMAVIAMSDHGHVGTDEVFDLVSELAVQGV
ncbi:alkaline phosphatase family protein [Roseomonas sp. WA12]